MVNKILTIDFFTGVLALVGVLQVILLFFSWWSTRKAVDAAKRSADIAGRTVDAMEVNAQRQLRAYCMVEKVKITGVKEGQIPEAVVTVKNFGQTPAKDFDHWGVINLMSFPLHPNLPANPDLTHRIKLKLSLGPQNLVSYSIPYKTTLSAADIALIENKVAEQASSALYVSGIIEYIDAFEVKRSTNYKFFFNAWRQTGEDEMTAYANGNDFT